MVSLLYTRLPCPSLSPRVNSNSSLLSQLYHPAIPSSVTHFSFSPQSFPESEFLAVSWLFTSGGQSIGASASASVLPKNIQGWFPLILTGLISLQSKGLSRVFFSTTNSKASILRCSAFFMVQFSHLCTTTGKIIALTRWTFFGKRWYLCFLICCLGL